ncbi:hypothetical protein SAMN05661096_03427 [Marivirga sericea]|uniref:Auto-transporter adhesin, head GIN domain n=1 Tax=Marivirga sericea TaxID=1028 RepID=A0A1X7L3C7_9BACT|nr:hypothetical protein [Marivirga sericea]SMG48147.1 hypothetical protein SAMN05661096_03427 [Marivirga sericea]
MKLSNKILIGLFGFLFLYMIVAFTEMRLKGDLNRLDDSNSISETVDIKSVQYLKLVDIGHRIALHGSNKPGIEIKSVSGDVLQYLKYDLEGDTLSIKSMDLEKKQALDISIYVSKSNFKGLRVDNASLYIYDLQQESLDIQQNAGWIRVNASNEIATINLNIQNSAYFNLQDVEVDTLNAIIDEAEVVTNEPIKIVKASMTNDSYLHLIGTSEIQIKKDESSRLSSGRLIVH